VAKKVNADALNPPPARHRVSAFTLQRWKTVKKPKEFLTTKAQMG
jgi:hypothetical protein